VIETTGQGTAVDGPSAPFWIREIVRSPEGGPEDRLLLEPGVNVLVGVPNTGKSKWLRMIDYLLGDDGKPDDVFGNDLATKYKSVAATLVVGGTEWRLERGWRTPEQVPKIHINDETTTLHGFALKLLDALKIPVVHYPQGNPYGARAWPELGWRSLYRHMYRRQQFWNDLADRQPESEQHACILQFVGLAGTLFSDEYGELVALEKRIQQLQNRREQFIGMLNEVSREVLDETTVGVALTPESIAEGIRRHEVQRATLQQRREAALGELLSRVSESHPGQDRPLAKDATSELGARLGELRAEWEECAEQLRRAETRSGQVEQHRALLTEELDRMSRAAAAGSILAPLKVTHCPACDRPVDTHAFSDTACHLCRRPVEPNIDSPKLEARLEFEVGQLREEIKETDRLLATLHEAHASLQAQQRRRREEMERLEADLRPVRSAAAAVLPPELTLWDQEAGRLQERIAQLRRVRSTLERRESIAGEIESIQTDVAGLQAALTERSKKISFERAGDLISDGMNGYFNTVNELKPRSWTPREVDFVLRDRTFVVRIGGSAWHSKLGGTLTLLFLIAYHYALMTLTSRPDCHYPGLCVLDFPPQLDGVSVPGSESFALTPFTQLAASNKHAGQVIAAGRSFADLESARRIEFTKVWV
jgi:hypothetical protein